MKEEKLLLALMQEEMTMMEYERRFHDLSMFAPNCIPIKKHMIDRLRDGCKNDLNWGLVAHQFEIVRELIVATQTLETCIIENQGQSEFEKRKIIDFSSSRPPIPKRSKSGQMFKKRWKSSSQSGAPFRSFQGTDK
jgi:hypothetical protein